MTLLRPLLLLSLVVSLVSGSFYLSGFTFLPIGPSYQVAETTRWLWEHGNLDRFEEDLKEVTELSRTNPGGLFWVDVFSEGRDGRLLPKHCLLASLIALPFFAIFGEIGFWICNQLFLFSIVVASYCLIRERHDGVGSERRIFLLLLASQLLLYSYNFSYDLLAAALILGGTSLISRRPFLGGSLLSLVLLVRVTDILFLPFVLLARMPGEDVAKWVTRSAAGIFGGVSLFCLSNWYLWGGALTTAYHRVVVFKNGEMMRDTFSHYMSLELFLTNWWDKLFGPDHGIILYNPLLLALPLLIWRSVKTPLRETSPLLVASLINCGIIFSYSHWMASDKGNRFLMPSIFVVLVLILREVWSKHELPSKAK